MGELGIPEMLPAVDFTFRTYGSPSLPVGGIALPTNKLEIVAPFAALAGLIVAVSAVVAVKRRRD